MEDDDLPRRALAALLLVLIVFVIVVVGLALLARMVETHFS